TLRALTGARSNGRHSAAQPSRNCGEEQASRGFGGQAAGPLGKVWQPLAGPSGGREPALGGCERFAQQFAQKLVGAGTTLAPRLPLKGRPHAADVLHYFCTIRNGQTTVNPRGACYSRDGARARLRWAECPARAALATRKNTRPGSGPRRSGGAGDSACRPSG